MLKRVPHFDCWVDPKEITNLRFSPLLLHKPSEKEISHVHIQWSDGTEMGGSAEIQVLASVADDIARNVAEWIERETAPPIQPPEPKPTDAEADLARIRGFVLENWCDQGEETPRVREIVDAFHEASRLREEWRGEAERLKLQLAQPPEPPVEDEAVKKAGENLTAVATWWAEKGMANFKPFRVFFEQAHAVALAAKGMDWEVPE